MVKRLTRIGNSQGIIIDRAILDLLKIANDTLLEIETDGTNLIIKPIRTKKDSRETRIATITNKVVDQHEETFRKLSK